MLETAGLGFAFVMATTQSGSMGERVAKVEQWMLSHERQCDRRHAENQDRLAGLESNLQRLVYGVGGAIIVGLVTLVATLMMGHH